MNKIRKKCLKIVFQNGGGIQSYQNISDKAFLFRDVSSILLLIALTLPQIQVK